MNPKVCIIFENLGEQVHIFATESSLLGVCKDGQMIEKKISHVDDLFVLSINGFKRLAEIFYEEILILKGEITNGKSSE